ncbi:SDR family NAD(P)-dependent oxidoreductase [Actinoplanes siamensis]|uniref:Short-chain dehydrogenase n=1 Tax=Actinoplanes siamensis TaxID=1223317 RepID=A0A919N728_9ACTN|nr:SDR family NAD(P)-dependent oxidoreductase [Actinoplanes siamensis]GIF05591.1 short-chain dehydrogenase [Actinoplanes siamensis]
MTRLDPYRFAGRTAVLTGAASGIGEQLAYGLAHRGSDLVLVDVDGARLDPVATRIRHAHPKLSVRTVVADLSDRAAVADVAAQAPASIGLLVNNAGVALGGRFDQVSVDQFEHVMNVNFRAPMLLTHALLPALTAAPGGHLVNVSSLFGLIAPPGQSAYCASKFALRGLSESLRGELIESRTGVTTVHPGGIRTRIAESALIGADVPRSEIEPTRKLFAALLSFPADKAAELILKAVEKRKARLLIAANAKGPDLLQRLLPVGSADIIRKLTSVSVKAAGRSRVGAGR